MVQVKINDQGPFEFEPPAGFKDEPISYTHFGILNGQRPGPSMEVYFDDLVLNGREFHFDQDPKWEEHGNHVTFEDHEPAGVQQYGYQQDGSAGGVIWNSE